MTKLRWLLLQTRPKDRIDIDFAHTNKTAFAADEGYRFNDSTGRCEKAGKVGRNPEFVGECGDLRGPDLRGVYLYGDYCSGRIWGLDAAIPGQPSSRPSTPLRATSPKPNASSSVSIFRRFASHLANRMPAK